MNRLSSKEIVAAERMKNNVETDNPNVKRQWAIAIGTLTLAVLLSVYIYWPERTYHTDQRYFSDDDGKTWFADDVNHIPPFSHNGKEAVAAIIYSYSGGSNFCGYLMKFSDEVKKSIEQSAAGGASKTPPVTAASIAYGTEISASALVKPPLKSSAWVPMRSAGDTVLSVKSPNGAALDQVVP